MSARLGQITLIIVIIAVGYYWFSVAQGSLKVGKTLQTTTTLETGLVGHWTFDGSDMSTATATDASGSGNDGTLTGGPVPAAGTVGQGIEFDGTDDYVDLGTDSSLQSTTELTISAWVYASAAPTVEGRTVVSTYDYENPGADTGYNFGALWTGNGFDFRVYDGVSDISDIAEDTDFFSVNLNKWVHVAGTFKGSTFVRLYVDGKLVQEDSSVGVSSIGYTGGISTLIGRRSAESQSEFAGNLDDVRIYNRALSADEITQLYNQGSGSKVSKTLTPSGLENGLVGHWTFDGEDMDWGTEFQIQDVSGTGNEGRAQGGMATATSPTLGVVGQAMKFDGVSNEILVAQDTSINDLSPLTMAMWVKPEVVNAWDDLVNKAGLDFRIGPPDGRISFWVAYSGTDLRSDSVDGTLVAGEWQHVVVTWDGGTDASEAVNLYKNANEVTYETGDVIDPTGTRTTDASTELFLGDNGFTGLMDDIRIYNRVLSADEITQLYVLGSGIKTNQTFTPSGLNSGLVGHWTFDGLDMTTATATDVSVSGNDGTLTNGPMVGFGKIGQALEFDGTNDFVDVADDASLGITGDATITAWVKSDGLPPSGVDIIITKQGAGGSDAAPYQLAIKDNGQLRWYHAVQGGSPAEIIDSTDTIAAGDWYHIAAVRDVGNNLKFYINSVADSANPHSSTETPGDYSGGVRIARHNDSTREFDGKLDDVRLYNRVLSADEIQQLYNMGR